MEHYIIHTCAERKWYVENYLIQALTEQHINHIAVYIDYNKDGQIKSLINSYKCIGDKDAWHLQDDIIISSRFKELTEKNNSGIVCGFCNGFSSGQPGITNVWNMWYSMPCIRIPGSIFAHFVRWLQNEDAHKNYRDYFEENKHDDVLFQSFLKDNYSRTSVLNLAPNVVNHIDYLLGGSLLNKSRNYDRQFIMSKYWDEPDLLSDIEDKLEERRKEA